MGGTSCKVAIFKGSDFINPFKKKIFKTSTTCAQDTLDEMTKWINGTLGKRIADSLGLACFGPLCLNKNDKNYGTITTTPKLAWQNVTVLRHFKTQLKFDKRDDKIFFDRHAGHKIEIQKQTYHVIKAQDVVIVL